MIARDVRAGQRLSIQWTLLWLLSIPVLAICAEPTVIDGYENCRALGDLGDRELATLDIDAYRDTFIEPPVQETRYRIARLRIVRQNVFPQAENWLGRLANRLHKRTTEGAIRAALPFAPGAEVTAIELQEAERILRQKPFFYDALVVPTLGCEDGIELLVLVRDVWTLSPTLGASRSGGDNKINAGIADLNLLGSGKSITLEYISNRDRSGTLVELRDPNVLGTRWTARLTAADNDDGELHVLEMVRPFFSLDTNWAAGVRLERFERDKDLEFLGEDLFELEATSSLAEVFLAHSKGRHKGWIDRRYLGLRSFREAVDFPMSFPMELTDDGRQRRRFTYPYLRWERQQDRFVKQANITRVGITEDLQLGWSFHAEAGWSGGILSDADDALLLSSGVRHQRFFGSNQLFSVDLALDSRYDLDASTTEALLGRARFTYLNRFSDRWRFFASARYRHTENLLPDDQLTLGGDVGLRGYPSRYQPGDRSYLLTVEQRYHAPITLFKLIRVGFAAFVDAGQAWFHDKPPAYVPVREGEHFDTLANVGLGLRLESIRTRRDRIVHIDVARPLVDGPEVSEFEVTVTAKSSF